MRKKKAAGDDDADSFDVRSSHMRYAEIAAPQEARYGTLTPKRLSELMADYDIPSAYALELQTGIARSAICRHLAGKSALSAFNRRRLALLFKRHRADLL